MQFAPAERERHKIALPIRNNGVARTKRILLYYRVVRKSVNLQYITLGRLDDGTTKSSAKRLMFQVLFFLGFL